MHDLPSIVHFFAQGDTAPLGHSAGGSLALSSTLAAAAVFAGVMLVGFWYQRRQASPKPAHARPSEGSSLANDLTELTERLANQLDHKAERIEALIAAADERIRSLERLSLETARSAPADLRLIEPRHRVRHGAFGADASHQEVYELSDAGLAPVDIARKLDKPTGQVELILNLRRGSVAL